jgi:hypothetical protein
MSLKHLSYYSDFCLIAGGRVFGHSITVITNERVGAQTDNIFPGKANGAYVVGYEHVLLSGAVVYSLTFDTYIL